MALKHLIKRIFKTVPTVYHLPCPCCGEKMTFLTYIKGAGYTMKANIGHGLDYYHVSDLLEPYKQRCQPWCEWKYQFNKRQL